MDNLFSTNDSDIQVNNNENGRVHLLILGILILISIRYEISQANRIWVGLRFGELVSGKSRIYKGALRKV